MADPAVGPRPGRSKPRPAAQAGRWVAAGSAVGAGLAMVGVMSATAENDGAEAAPNQTKRVVVLPQEQTSPARIVVLLPEQANPGMQPVVQQPARVMAAPARPTPGEPAAQTAPEPVTESSGT